MRNHLLFFLVLLLWLPFHFTPPASGIEESLGFPDFRSPTPEQAEFAAISASATAGDAESQFFMGCFYANGDVVEQDYDKAAEWYAKSGDQGNARAQHCLGLLYECGAGVERDYGKSFSWYMRSVGQGDLAAHLGIAGFHFAYRKSHMPLYFGEYSIWRAKALFMSGTVNSVPSYEANFWHWYNSGSKYYLDFSKLFDVVSKRSRDGDGESTLCLAKMVYHAQGVRRDVAEGNRLVHLAIEQGSLRAMFIVGATFNRNALVKTAQTGQESLELMSRAKESVEEPYFASYYHAKCLELYERGQVAPMSVEELEKHKAALSGLAELGLVHAQYELGRFLVENEEDALAVGFSLLERAAENGHYRAMASLGVARLFGREGVPQDMVLGKEWLDRALGAADFSHAMSIMTLFERYAKWFPGKAEEILAWLHDLDQAEDATAPAYIGLLLRAPDPESELPQRWYVKALKQKVYSAAYFIKRDAELTEELLLLGVSEEEMREVRASRLGERDPALFLYGAKNGHALSIATLSDMFGFPNPVALRKKWLEIFFTTETWYTVNSGVLHDVSFSVDRYYDAAGGDGSRHALNNGDGVAARYLEVWTFFKR